VDERGEGRLNSPIAMIYTKQDRTRRLQEMQQLAIAHGGVCLSNCYVDTRTKLHWRCAKGHEWNSTRSTVLQGAWCGICADAKKAHTIEMMQKIAAERGGECLSKIYKNNTTKLRWCCKHGHEWEAVPGSIVGTKLRKGSWCPFCIGKLPKNLALHELQKLAASRGGRLLSKQYKNAVSHLRWQCAKGHQWQAIPDAVKRGSWCPVCAGSFPLNISKMRKAARVFSGRCLSREYVNANTPLCWRCAEGHEWNAKPAHVLSGHWCPTCASGISERICRALLERMTGVLFPKVKPSWLRNERGRKMELDGYAQSLGLAFEYQGYQHYELVPHLHSTLKNFKQRQRDDEIKRRLCSQYDVTLVEIPYYVSHDKLQQHLAEKLRGFNPKLIIDDSLVKVGQLGVWRRKDLEEMRKIAAAHGGKLLSKSYIDTQTKLRWRCAEGHTWEAIPSSIKRGSWCGKCGDKRAATKRALSIDEMRALAMAKGGVCLSINYRNVKSRLRWRCAKGHEWETQASVILGGHWCRKCESFRLGRKYALTLEDMQNAATTRGGKCLSETYINGRQKLLWCCAKGHKWEAVGLSIRSGTWCPICAGKHPKLVAIEQ
jgi:hypothetical protein